MFRKYKRVIKEDRYLVINEYHYVFYQGTLNDCTCFFEEYNGSDKDKLEIVRYDDVQWLVF